MTSTHAQALQAAPDADALLGYCEADLLAAAPKTVWVQSFSVGVENCVALPAIRERDIVVTNMQRALGPSFSDVSVRSFCLFAPPSFFQGFSRRHPRLTRWLMRGDDRLGAQWPFREAGDFIAITARYKG
mgnify:CR=1 FL=1